MNATTDRYWDHGLPSTMPAEQVRVWRDWNADKSVRLGLLPRNGEQCRAATIGGAVCGHMILIDGTCPARSDHRLLVNALEETGTHDMKFRRYDPREHRPRWDAGAAYRLSGPEGALCWVLAGIRSSNPEPIWHDLKPDSQWHLAPEIARPLDVDTEFDQCTHTMSGMCCPDSYTLAPELAAVYHSGNRDQIEVAMRHQWVNRVGSIQAALNNEEFRRPVGASGMGEAILADLDGAAAQTVRDGRAVFHSPAAGQALAGVAAEVAAAYMVPPAMLAGVDLPTRCPLCKMSGGRGLLSYGERNEHRAPCPLCWPGAGAHEFACPSCGAVIRARMADQ